ncbi:MAG: hypothetical protein P3X22_006360 [Thermoprotei archaeon]|nr:hypothetical protein [Thermoprotei archaeon]
MLVVTVYTSFLSDNSEVEAALEATETVRGLYGVDVFVDVVNVDLVSPHYPMKPLIVVGDRVIEWEPLEPRDFRVKKIVKVIIEAILLNVTIGEPLGVYNARGERPEALEGSLAE